MKRLIVLTSALFLVLSLYSQEQEQSKRRYNDRNEVKTLFGPRAGNGGYGAFSLGYGEIDGRNGLIMGARGEWIIGHGLGLGIAGYGFANEPWDGGDGRSYSLAGGYGGFIFEPILMGRWPVHLSFPILLGAGGVALTSTNADLYDPDPQFEEASVFLVAEPGVELEFNLVRWFRLAFYGNYRYTTDLFLSDPLNPNAMNGWGAGITMKIGSF